VSAQDPSGEAASAAQKHLTYYELDLGLNHVLRKWSDPVDNGANLLIPVPGSGDGPGGVLVCAENFLLYRHQVRLGGSTKSSGGRCRCIHTSSGASYQDRYGSWPGTGQ
jgi:hypothetical protein